jgi:ferredoxin
MGVALFLAINILIGIGALSLLTGAFHFLFVKPSFKFLKSQHGSDGFAFGLSWNHTADEARYNQIKIHLFNPFGSPTQLEITRSFDAHDSAFAEDLNIGAPLKGLIAAKGFDDATVEIEVTSKMNGITYLLSMKGKSFLEKINTAKETALEFNEGHKIVKVKPIYHEAADRSFISAPLPRTGKVLKLATNPEFAGQFAGGGDAPAAGAAVSNNYAVSKVWIEPGCIVCNACEGIFPEVFKVTDTCIVLPTAPLDNGLKIQEAAEACPVEVIKFTKI